MDMPFRMGRGLGVGFMLAALVAIATTALGETVHVRGGMTNSTRPVDVPDLGPDVELVLVTVDHTGRMAQAYESDIVVEGRPAYTGDVVGLGGWVADARIRQGWTLRSGAQALVAGRSLSHVQAHDYCLPGDDVIDWTGPSAAWFDTPASSSASVLLTRAQLTDLTLTTQGRSEVHLDVWVVFLPGYVVQAQIAWLCYSAWEADVTFEPLDALHAGGTVQHRPGPHETQELITMADPTKEPEKTDEKPKVDDKPKTEPAAPRERVQFLPKGGGKPQVGYVTARSKIDPNVATVEVEGKEHQSIVRWSGQGDRPEHACWRNG